MAEMGGILGGDGRRRLHHHLAAVVGRERIDRRNHPELLLLLLLGLVGIALRGSEAVLLELLWREHVLLLRWVELPLSLLLLGVAEARMTGMQLRDRAHAPEARSPHAADATGAAAGVIEGEDGVGGCLWSLRMLLLMLRGRRSCACGIEVSC